MRLTLLLTAAAIALTAQPAAASTYAGWIVVKGKNNDDPLVLTTNSAGTRVRAAVMAFRPVCQDGRKFALHRLVVVRKTDGPGAELVPIRNSGGHFAATLRGSSIDETTNYAFTETGTITGTFHRGSARGAMKVTVTVANLTTGAPVTTCATKTMHWTARRKLGRYYGGITAQGEPVYMSLTRNRRMVWEFGIDWHASCSNGAFADLPDWLTEFRIRNGRFGDTFGFRDPSGNRIFGKLSGRVARSRASGSITVSAQAPNGVTCTTGPQRWSMRSG